MTVPAAPASFLLVTGLVLGVQGVLVADYLNLRLALVAGFPSLAAVFDEGAVWLGWAWALAVWAGFGGGVLLALRDGGAPVVLFLSALAALVCLLGAALTDHAPLVDFLGVPWPLVAALVITVPGLGWLHARSLRKRGLLG